MAKVGMARGALEDFFGEKRVRLGSYELLDSRWRLKWEIGARRIERLLVWVF